MEIFELVALLKTKILEKIEDYEKLDKEKSIMQKEIVGSLQSLEDLLKQNSNLLPKDK